jgi:hypothetical protein
VSVEYDQEDDQEVEGQEGEGGMRTSFTSDGHRTGTDSDDLEFVDANDESFTQHRQVDIQRVISDIKHDDDINGAGRDKNRGNKKSPPPKDVDDRLSHSSLGSFGNDSDDDGGDAGKRGAQHREYIKVLLATHMYWRDGNYWEQALCQCAFEQLQTMPYDKVWHDMDRDTRLRAVIRVHDVIFSQVMALIHSMIELNCSKTQAREFLYRMCVVHQLSEAQRQQLIVHIMGRGDN